MAACPFLADPEDILGGRIQRDDQKVNIEEDDAGAQIVEDAIGVTTQRVVAVSAVEAGIAGARLGCRQGAVACGLRTLVCCT